MGEDIRDIAKQIYAQDGELYLDMAPERRRQKMVEYALPFNIELMRQHLERYRITYDRWFHESELISSGYVDETMNLLTAAGYTYEKDGALWLRNTEFGADKDEVLLRSNGFYTYYASDIAYHRDKFTRRGFDRVIDVFGADHHGHSLRFKATMTAPGLGLSDKKLDFLITQMVRLVRDGETVKVSKRTGRALTLNDLLDEIGVDACRFFFCAKPDTHLEFDLDLAIRQDSENPVYYVQYAHARIYSILRNLESEGITLSLDFFPELLSTEREMELIWQLAQFPEEIRLAAREYDPSRICRYLIELAGRFHRFYTSCRIKGEDAPILQSRLFLIHCVRTVIKSALGIIGVNAPERM
jgi:arginyl-tRNA synthetase